MGIQSGTFYRYHSGEKKWPLELLFEISERFGVNLDYLILGPKKNEHGVHIVKKDIYKLQEENDQLRAENKELKIENQKLRSALSPQMVATILSPKQTKKGK